jgi:CheY-like chemotaxis protein
MTARILVADDSVTIQKVIEFTLGREDVELIQARSGDEAMQKAREAKPDLMLVDHSMPGQSGPELCGAIRQDPQLKNVPIILMTGVSGNVDEAAARQAGATDVVSKPFESQVLIGMVKQLLLSPPAPVETQEPRFVLDSQEQEQEEEINAAEIKMPAGLTEEESPAGTVTVGASEEVIPTYDLSPAGEIDLAMEPVTQEDTQPSSPYEIGFEDMAAAVGMGTAGIGIGAREGVELDPSPPSVQQPPQAPSPSTGPVTIPPEMVEKLAREVSEQVAAHIVQELRADLIQQIEKLLWEIVPDLAEQLLTQEIQRIRDLVEGRK